VKARRKGGPARGEMTKRRGLGFGAMLLLAGGCCLLACAAAHGQDAAPAAEQAAEVGQLYDHPVVESLLFYSLAAATVVAALGVCIARDIVRMAIWLFVTLSTVAMLYFLLAAPFLGAIQLIVYAGGTLVLLVFGVMLTSRSPWIRFEVRPSELLAAGAACLVLLVGLVAALLRAEWPEAAAGESPRVATLGAELLTTYLVPFEAISVLLLVVMIAAAYLVRQEPKE